MIDATAAETGLPCDDPVRFGAEACGRTSRRASTPCPGSPSRRRPTPRGGARARVTFSVTATTLVLALRDPFRIARAPTARPHGDHGHRGAARRRRWRDGPVGLGEGFPGRLLRRDAGHGGRGPARPARGDRTRGGRAPRGSRRSARGPRGRGRPHGGGHRPQRRGQVRDRHRPPRPRRQAARPPGARAARLSTARSRRPTSRSASTSRRSSRSARGRAAHFPALKIKVGGPSDLDDARARSGASSAGRSGSTRTPAGRSTRPGGLMPELVRLGVELIEQPFPAHRLDQLRWLQERSELPLVADESAVTIDDLEGLVGVVAGVNVKLAKCGGIGPARRMLERARELGFKTFLGCMEETSRRDRRVGPRRAPGRLDRPRRLPAARGRPVRGPRARPRLPLAAADGPGLGLTWTGSRRLTDPRQASWPMHPQVSRRPGALSTDRCGVWTTWWTNIVDKPPADDRTAGLRCADRRRAEGARGRERPRHPTYRTRRTARFRGRRALQDARMGEEDRHRC